MTIYPLKEILTKPDETIRTTDKQYKISVHSSFITRQFHNWTTKDNKTNTTNEMKGPLFTIMHIS